MLFNTFGDSNNPAVLIMHGMLCDWKEFYVRFKGLEEKFYLVVPAMDGCFDGSLDFTSFADQCRQIEEFVNERLNGELYAVYGISQGATLMSELLARNVIKVRVAVFDGVYVAHQGKWCVSVGMREFKKFKKNGGKPTKVMLLFMKLMGLDKDDMAEFSCMYWGWSENSARRNLTENYTYHANPLLKQSDTKVYLWCGSKEAYAKKSHRMLKSYLKNYEEKIYEGMGHGEMFFSNTEVLMNDFLKAIN